MAGLFTPQLSGVPPQLVDTLSVINSDLCTHRILQGPACLKPVNYYIEYTKSRFNEELVSRDCVIFQKQSRLILFLNNLILILVENENNFLIFVEEFYL